MMPRQSTTSGRTTFALMGIAALLIVNSHMEPIYPRSFMAADGLIGNLIFFLLSGFGITIGQMQRRTPFLPFYFRRFQRIYIPLFLVVATQMLVGHISADHWISNYLWPTQYGFIAQIILCYPLIWLLAGPFFKKWVFLVYGAGLLWLVECAKLALSPSGENLSLGQLPSSLWISFYFLAISAGVVMARRNIKFQKPVFPLLTLAISYVAIKFELTLRLFSTPAQVPSIYFCIVLQVLALAIGVMLLGALDFLNDCIKKLHLLPTLNWLGQRSLELYITHSIAIVYVAKTNVPWPVKVGLVYGASFIVAEIVLQISRRVIGFIDLIVKDLRVRSLELIRK